jgi:UDP-N-acetylmuramate dehydrogenase
MNSPSNSHSGSTCKNQAKNLSAHNTLALPCLAQDYTEVANRDELEAYLSKLEENAPLLVLGGGSNLVLPEALTVPVLKLADKRVRYEACGDDTLVHVCAGLEWDDLVAEVVAKDLRGLENLSLIPGTVGAAPVQNIGAYGVELKDTLVSLDAYDRALGCFVRLKAHECEFAYRDSIFKRQPSRYIIVEASFKLSKSRPFTLDYGELKALSVDEKLSVQAVRDTVISVRRAKLPDPLALPNAGSFFKNPIVSADQFALLKTRHPNIVAYAMPADEYKLAAGWLIDNAGWKGKAIGPITVHAHQALVLTNTGGGTQKDVLLAAKMLIDDVHVRYGVLLEIEPVIIASE